MPTLIPGDRLLIRAAGTSVREFFADTARMKHSKFKIGMEFTTGAGRWRCTDVGTRTIAAIRLHLDHDPSWYNGPPYAVSETVFDEYGMEDCDPAPRRRKFDDSGKAGLVIQPRTAPQNR
jgi:hypothetical protein